MSGLPDKPKRQRKSRRKVVPAKVGAKSPLTEPIESEPILEAIVRGFGTDASMVEIAASAGISDRVLYKWRERGRIALEACGGREADCERDELPYLRLYMRTSRERAIRRIERREAIEEAGERDWRALAYLEDRADRMDLLRGDSDDGAPVSDADIDAEVELMQETVEEFGFEMVRRRTTTTRRRTRKAEE